MCHSGKSDCLVLPKTFVFYGKLAAVSEDRKVAYTREL